MNEIKKLETVIGTEDVKLNEESVIEDLFEQTGNFFNDVFIKSRVGPNTKLNHKKISSNKYSISIDLEDYILKKNDRYFKFDKVTIGLDILFDKESIQFLRATKIKLGKKYDNPFVFNDNSICYGGGLRWRLVGVDFGKKYSIKTDEEKNNAAWKTCLVLTEGAKVLHEVHGDQVIPVNNLMNRFSDREICKNKAELSGLIIYGAESSTKKTQELPNSSNLYIRLDGAFANKVILAKRVPETILSEPLDEVIRYMCNPTSDELNEELEDNPSSCYTEQEVSTAKLFQEAFDEGINSPNKSFEVQAISVDGNSLIYLGRDADLKTVTLDSKRSEILMEEHIDEGNYNLIDLKGTYVSC